MQVGKLRHRVQLQSSAETRSTVGEPTKTWTTFATVWAKVEPLLGNVALQAQQINAELTHRVTIRHNGALTEGDRIKWGSRLFDINVIKNISERNITQELLCKEARE